MGLKGWLHVLATFLGLALAGLIVFLVFGQASEQGQVSGEAPEEETQCTTIAPDRSRSPAAISAATDNVPPVVDAKGARVKLTPEERTWIANMHAASGLCLRQVNIRPSQWVIQATYPSGVEARQLETYAMDTLSRAFEEPLAQSRVLLETQVDGQARTVNVQVEAWRAFQRSRTAFGVERSVAGLREFSEKTAYDQRFIRTAGW